MNFTLNPNTGVLKIGESLTIAHAMELQKVLGEAMEKTSYLKLDLGEVEEMEVAPLQLITSAYRYSVKHKKGFFVLDNWSDELKKSVNESGFWYIFDEIREYGNRFDKSKVEEA